MNKHRPQAGSLLSEGKCSGLINITVKENMAAKHWHLITYDVRDPKRLRQVAKKLEGYGTRVQYSVFRCRLDQLSLERLHWELNQIMDAEDDLLVIPLCGACASKVPDHSTGDQSDWAEKPASFRIV